MTNLSELGARLSNAGRWGPDDERGTLNFRPENYQDACDDAERELCLQDPGNVIIDLQIYNLLQLVRGNWRDSIDS